MRHTLLYFLVAALVLATGCKKDFLERLPQDRLVDESFWTNEANIRTYAYDFYPDFFTGYGSSYTWGAYFSGQSLNDDFAPSTPPQFTKVVPSSSASTLWRYGFERIRRANIMIDRIPKAPIEEAAQKHWTGIGRFFRALQYHDLVQTYGDVPWYDQPLLENDPELYKPRDPRAVVVDHMLEDFRYAAENVRAADGTAGLTVNKYVVLAFMSRVFLYHGTYFKYHNIDQTKAVAYLEAAKWAANEVIQSGKYAVSDSYRGLFNSANLAGNKEMILYRSYEAGLLTHSLHSYVNKEPQTGASKDAVEAFLAKDGLPIPLSPLYQGDKTIGDVMANRDPRLIETFVQELRLNGVASNYSTSGYSVRKFLNDAMVDATEGSSNLNITDAPIIRYGEVLLNYAEATAELGQLTQADLDKSINKLRQRPGVNMPDLEVIGGQPAVNGVVYDDPERDPAVPSMIWEIRRERRTELMFEGFRLDDLKRWKKLEYTDTKANPDINLGAWIRKADYTGLKDVVLENGADEGYIQPAWKAVSQRLFTDPKVYLEPLPLDQIKLYEDQGVTLEQNPGW